MSWLPKNAIPMKEYRAKKLPLPPPISAACDSAVKPIQYSVRTKLNNFSDFGSPSIHSVISNSPKLRHNPRSEHISIVERKLAELKTFGQKRLCDYINQVYDNFNHSLGVLMATVLKTLLILASNGKLLKKGERRLPKSLMI